VHEDYVSPIRGLSDLNSAISRQSSTLTGVHQSLGMLSRCLIVGAVKADRARELAALVYEEDTVMRHCLSRHRRQTV
jgi:hypothetical protein